MAVKNRSILGIVATIMLGVAPLAWGQMTPSQDAYTNSASPTANFGTAVTLDTASTASSIQTTYIQFDLSAVPSGYSGANVARATLKLYINAVSTAGNFNADYVDGSWAEKTITANLAPALGATIASSIPLTSANVHNYLQIDLTTAVQAWLNGTQPNDGIALVANSPLSATFDSKENSAQSHPAELDIVFSGNGTITGVTTASGSGLTGGGTTGTLKLGLTTTCSANQVLQWNGGAWGCATAGSGTVTTVASGAGLTGGPISGSGTLSIATGGVTNPMLANPSLLVNAGTGLSGGGAVSLGGATTLNVDTTKIPLLTGANTFTASEVVNESGSPVAITANQTATTGVAYGVAGSSASSAGYGVYGYTPAGGFGVFSGSNLGSAGDLRQDVFGVNNGSVTPGGIRFGVGNSGEGIASDRTGAVNQNGIDLYTNFKQRLSVTNTGYVGIGTTAPANQLEVHAQSAVNAITAAGLTPANGSRLPGGVGLTAAGGNADRSSDLPGGVGITGSGGIGGANFGTDGAGGVFTGGNYLGLGDGIEAYAGSGYAGVFHGDMDVSGSITAGTKDFRIDHPLDPGNKYLYHSSVESSEMMNIYTGNITTDARGEAAVPLPDWFEVLNTDFRYQLTVIGVFAQAIVSREIENHQFQIRTNLPNVKVSWQITGVRQDAYAKAHPLVVERQKEERLRGFYIHPELYGASEEKQIEWARHPETMRRLRENRQKQSAAAQH